MPTVAPRSLTSIMSAPGRLEATDTDPEVMRLIAEPPVADRAGAIERAVRIGRAVGSPGMFDEDSARDGATRAWDRTPSTAGLARQGQAMAASGDRSEGLRTLRMPALVIDAIAEVAGRARTAA